MKWKDKIYILEFERCGVGCCDAEIRLCVANTEYNAIKIAKEHRDKYYKGWSYSVTRPDWMTEDNTAYVYSHYS